MKISLFIELLGPNILVSDKLNQFLDKEINDLESEK